MNKILIILLVNLLATTGLGKEKIIAKQVKGQDCLNFYKDSGSDFTSFNLTGGAFLGFGVLILAGAGAPVAYILGSGLTSYGGLTLLGLDWMSNTYEPSLMAQVASEIEQGVIKEGVRKVTEDLKKRTAVIDEEQTFLEIERVFKTEVICEYPSELEVENFIRESHLELDSAFKKGDLTEELYIKEKAKIKKSAKDLSQTIGRVSYERFLYELVNPLTSLSNTN